jgi:hypothetical protein
MRLDGQRRPVPDQLARRLGQFPRRDADSGPEASVGRMKTIFLKALAGGVVLIMMLLLAGCPGIPNDGRYQDHDGGRSNFRA